MKKTTFLALYMLLSSVHAGFAQDVATAAVNSDAPVEIFADSTLEWDRVKKTYTARGNAVARQGTMQVKSDSLTAHYSESGEKSTAKPDAMGGEITKLVAAGNVAISSAPYTAHGDKAVYDITTGIATLTGADLRIETPTEKLTAEERIEFDTSKNRLSAIGKANARRGTDSLTADRLDAFFKPAADGKTALDRIVSDSAVTIKTARETVTGDSGVYDVTGGKATLRGRVRILQGENWLEGTRAEVDLKTGISKLFADGKPLPGRTSLIVDGVERPPVAPVGDGRVRGVFYPKKKAPDAAAPETTKP
jgi:lipopolysaccharide export system protein LptA